MRTLLETQEKSLLTRMKENPLDPKIDSEIKKLNELKKDSRTNANASGRTVYSEKIDDQKRNDLFNFVEAINEGVYLRRMQNSNRWRTWESLKKIRKYILKDFGKRYYEILKYRLGVDRHNLDQTAKKFNMTRERVRTMETKVLKYYGFDLN